MARTAFGPGCELDGGKYRIVRLLGSGGMGSVFEAEHTRTRKRVAVKCMHPTQPRSPGAEERLIREAEAAGRVRHPNVVDVYDVGCDNGTVYLVMEYLEGEPLTNLLVRGGLPMWRLIALLLPAMRGVAAAHKQGVIHRDIKPDNIFLAVETDAAEPVPKVLDFGISKLDSRGDMQLTLTRSGATLGTPRYMAYEQLTAEKDIDGRVDVYAFGVILYEALTGKLPYEADTYPELIVKVATRPPTPPKELRADIPTSLDRLVRWALAREREERVSSMEALIHELVPFATEHGFRAEMTLSDESIPAMGRAELSESAGARKPAPIEAKPRRAVRWVAGAVALALVVLFAQRWLREPARVAAPAASLGDASERALPAAIVQPVPSGAPAEPQPAPAPATTAVEPPSVAAGSLQLAAAGRPGELQRPRKKRLLKQPTPPSASSHALTEDPGPGAAPSAPPPPEAAAAEPPEPKPAVERSAPAEQFRVKPPQSRDFY